MALSVHGPGDTVAVADPPAVRVTGAEPGAAVTLRVSCEDGRGARHWSAGTYRAGDDGAVDPRTSPSAGGSYTGVDPFGLWWSLAGRGAFAPGERFATTVDVLAGERRMGQAAFTRAWCAGGVTREPLGDAGVCFLPARLPAPAVLVLGGSDGGVASAAPVAAGLAAHGLVGCALAYFGAPGLPRRLRRIPLEDLEAALERLVRHPAVSGDRIGVLGRSRGGELALLLGATSARVGPVVGIVPSGVAWGVLGLTPFASRVAWTHRGRPVPFADIAGPAATALAFARHRVVLRPLFERRLAEGAAAAATIPVERIGGRMLLVSGGDDQLWPSEALADVAIERLREHGAAGRAEHLRYPDAGHAAGRMPFLPVGPTVVRHPRLGVFLDLGGEKAANGRASSDAWPRIVAFLRDELRS